MIGALFGLFAFVGVSVVVGFWLGPILKRNLERQTTDRPPHQPENME